MAEEISVGHHTINHCAFFCMKEWSLYLRPIQKSGLTQSVRLNYVGADALRESRFECAGTYATLSRHTELRVRRIEGQKEQRI